jgi:hypothetical protein
VEGNLPDDTKQGKNTHKNASQYQKQEDPCPEFTRAYARKVRILRIHPGIDIIPEEKTAALGTDFVKYHILMTALRANERSFCAHNNTPLQCCQIEIKFLARSEKHAAGIAEKQ